MSILMSEIPFKIKRLTKSAKLPTQENPGDLWDLYADSFGIERNKELCILKELCIIDENKSILFPGGKILIRTGIAIELPRLFSVAFINGYLDKSFNFPIGWKFEDEEVKKDEKLTAYAVADIRPRSGLALKHGLTVLNTPGTIDNSYRKEIGVIMINGGHENYTIEKGDKIAQMLIRPLYPSKMEEITFIEDTGRGGFGSTGER